MSAHFGLRLSAPLPQNNDAEQAILGALIQTGASIEMPEFLHPDIFVLRRHKVLCREIIDRARVGRAFDVTTLRFWARSEIAFDEAGDGAEYLEALHQRGFGVGRIDLCEYTRIVADLNLQAEMERLPLGYDQAILLQVRQIADKRLAMGVVGSPGDNLISGVDLMAIEFPSAPQFIDGFLTVGLTMVISKPKVGKSWLILDNGLAVAAGWDALGGLQTERSDVLLLMLEDSEQRVQSRLRKLLGGRPCPPGVTFSTRWPKGEAAVEKVRTYLDKHPLCRFVGIDLWAKVRGEPGRASIYNDDYGALEAWQQLAQERGVAIVMVHHARKADAEDIVDSVSGTLGASGAVDHLIMIKGSREAGYSISLTGRDLLPRDWTASLDDGQWTLLGDKPYAKKVLDAVERIDRNNKIRQMRAAGRTEREIANELGVSKTTVHDALKSGHASAA